MNKNILDDKDILTNLDKSDMLSLIEDFPGQCRQAYKLAKGISLPASYKKIASIIFTGLGGSAICADIVKCYLLDKSKIPIFVNRDYTLPKFVSQDTLVIACSYSGDTEETLSAYKQAKKCRTRLLAIASGGQLIKLAKKDGIPFHLLPSGLPPRCAVGYSSLASLLIISRLGVIKIFEKDIDELSNTLLTARDRFLGFRIQGSKNLAKGLARKMYNRFVVIYGAGLHMEAIVTRFREQFAENSKTLVSSHVFPEMNHNEIVGWQFPRRLIKDSLVFILRDKDDHPRIKRRMDITKDIIEKEGAEVFQIYSIGRSLLSRMFSLMYIGDYISYYLAILNGIDPTPVDKVTYLKKELAKIK